MPVVIAPPGLGAPFTVSPQGLPAIIATNGYGLPINIVPEGGTPISFVYGWPTTTFTDDFNRADGPLGANWTKLGGGGTIEVVGNKAQVTVNGAATYVAPTTGSPTHFVATDYVAELAYILARVTDPSNYVGLRWGATAGGLMVNPIVGGVNTGGVIISMPEPDIGTRMELRIYNNKATAFLAGEAINGMVNIDVSHVPASNLCGIRANVLGAAAADNFACGSLT